MANEKVIVLTAENFEKEVLQSVFIDDLIVIGYIKIKLGVIRGYKACFRIPSHRRTGLRSLVITKGVFRQFRKYTGYAEIIQKQRSRKTENAKQREGGHYYTKNKGFFAGTVFLFVFIIPVV